jgi:hypothetical protein
MFWNEKCENYTNLSSVLPTYHWSKWEQSTMYVV